MKIHSLQALRAIAALLVVTDHALLDIAQGTQVGALTRIAWGLGTAGVFIFFVISGFIMVHISWSDFGKPGAAKNFMRRRIIRIVPLYWLATVAALAFHRVALTNGVHAGWTELALSLLFIPSHDETGAYRLILSQGWTLSYEMIFYVLVAASLTVSRLPGLLALGAALVIFSVAAPLFSHDGAAASVSPFVVCFGIGVLAGIVWRSWSLVEPKFLAMRMRSMEVFGDASYSVYLVHGFALTLLLRAWQRAEGGVSIWFVPAGVCLATLIGYLAHISVEKPILRFLSAPSAGSARFGRMRSKLVPGSARNRAPGGGGESVAPTLFAAAEAFPIARKSPAEDPKTAEARAL
jgi:peptidoglycan/LPS O-acetylase OafA/YrhL